MRKEGQVEGIGYEFIARIREGKKKLRSFSIIFKEPMTLKKQPSDQIDNLISDIDTYNENNPMMKYKLSKVRKMLSARSVRGTKNVLGENAVIFSTFKLYQLTSNLQDISALKQTIVSEYLPDDLTTSLTDVQ